ncbi:hypothetical protein VB711_11535 [Cronbergia sp. UHCC 0137]|uniref:hypothetical protein n=1 Tax=Cronbergia sp. UHCC 0137 TaxID=3110239 RepID=UPI002B1F2AF6|nr:hypothetical protein [Cronbergia sp. UHCC 0137]MEA5618463.1 hypothetical protein [Cronbergia sp. UHCC 0137]
MANHQPMDTNTRLDRLEDEFETVKQLLISSASYTEAAHKRIDRLADRQDITQRQLDGLSVTVQVMGEKVDRLADKVDGLTDKVDGLTDKVDRLTDKVDDFVDNITIRNTVVNDVVLELRDSQLSTNAAVERLEKILEQLLRQNRN